MNIYKRHLNVFGKLNVKNLGSFGSRSLSSVGQKNRFHINFDKSSFIPSVIPKVVFPSSLQNVKSSDAPLKVDDSVLTDDPDKFLEQDLDLLGSSLNNLLDGEGQEEDIVKSLDHLIELLDGDEVIQRELGNRKLGEALAHFTFGSVIQLQGGTKVSTPLTLTLIQKGITVLNYLCNHSNEVSAINHENIKRLHDHRAASGITSVLLYELCLRNKDIVFSSLHLMKSLHTKYLDATKTKERISRAVVKVLQNYGMDAQMLVHTLDVLCVVITNDISGQVCDELQKAGLTRSLSDLLSFHKNDKKVIRAALKVLTKYGVRTAAQKPIDFASDKLLELIDHYQNDSKMTNDLVRVLSSVFFCTPKSRVDLGDLGVCGTLVELYESRDSEEDRAVLMNAMRELSLDNAQNEKRFKKLGIVILRK